MSSTPTPTDSNYQRTLPPPHLQVLPPHPYLLPVELQTPFSPSPYVIVERAHFEAFQSSGKGFVDYELPKTVASARDGWQWTSSSGAVVSGLLAAVASQLLGMFKGDTTGPQGAHDFVVASCYVAIFLNINATIGSFVLVDHLGEVGYEAAKRDARNVFEHIGRTKTMQTGVTSLLQQYGASPLWTIMLIHWLLTFYLGILSLIVSLLTFAMMTEPKATKVALAFTVAVTLIPTTCFIFRGARKSK